MTTPELADFVKTALARGIPRAQVETALQGAGWTRDQIRAAISGFAEIDFPIPVPRARPQLDARDAFMHLVSFATLYTSAVHFGSLLFDLVNIALPDAADPDVTYARSGIRWAVSSLVVAVPVFVYMSWLIARDLRADPNKRHSKVRRWLTYLTLFVAALLLIGDLTALVYNLLGGDLTTRFLLKVVVVAFIAGSIFWYYLSDLRREER
jgi:hypothetical protein